MEGEIGVFRNVARTTRVPLQLPSETGLLLRWDRKVGIPFQTKQWERSSCQDQEGRRGSEEVVLKPWCSSPMRPLCWAIFEVSSRLTSSVTMIQWVCGISLYRLHREMASFGGDWATTWLLLTYGGILELPPRIQGATHVAPGKTHVHSKWRGRAGDCSGVAAGQRVLFYFS